MITHPQEWLHIYYDNISAYPNSLIESYDKGYVYAGLIYQGDIPKYGLIFKTDINGEMRWDKKIGQYGDVTGVLDIKQALDGGYILIGSTQKLDPYYDPFVMKLNACGEKEWCKILNLPGNMDFGALVVQLPNGNYIALLADFSYNPSERIWLMCFSESSDTLWKKVYAQTEPDIVNEEGYDLLVTSDSNILITGEGAFPDPDTTLYRQRPLLIKTDFDGNEKWTLPWGYTQYFMGHGVMSVEDNKGNIYTAGRHIRNKPNSGDSPVLLKTSKDGIEQFYSNVYDSTELGLATTISWLGDSTLAVGAGWRFSEGTIIEGIAKIDTSGNIQLVKDIIEAENTFQGSITTFDKKLLIMGGFFMGHNWDIYAYKFNQDLEYDTIYTQPFVYDSLCEHPIVSDTIPLDCVIVGLEEPKKEEMPRLSITPNPASDQIRVLLPEAVTSQSQNAVFNVTTWKYNYKGDIPLEIYDIYGQRWHTEVIPDGVKETEISVRTLSPGLYVVRVVIEGQAVSGKFIKK
jgi:hypothetical protein